MLAGAGIPNWSLGPRRNRPLATAFEQLTEKLEVSEQQVNKSVQKLEVDIKDVKEKIHALHNVVDGAQVSAAAASC